MILMEAHLQLSGGHVRKNSLLLLLLPLIYSINVVTAEKAASLAEDPNDTHELVRFFSQRGIHVPSSAAKMEAWRSFMPDDTFRRLNRQHKQWLKAAARYTVPKSPPAAIDEGVVPDFEKNPATPAPRRPLVSTAAPALKPATKPVTKAPPEPLKPVVAAADAPERPKAEETAGAAANPPKEPEKAEAPAASAEEVQPHADSVVLFDTSFGLADHPNNEFHMWRAPFPTFGQAWPMPAQITVSEEHFFRLDRTRLAFRASGESNYILLTAFTRVREVLGEMLAASYYPKQWAHQEGRVARLAAGGIHNVEVRVRHQGRSWPHLHMDESYKLIVDSSGVRIFANETWGALHGLETFSQLIWQTRDNAFYINKTAISDRPRFKHRGMLVDTGRHFIRKEIFLKNLDAMAYNKMNVLHWHMVDDQSFPFQSQTFPNLSNQGAYDRTHMVYTPDDVREILEHARERGIRVIPEFDSPGHTYSWGKGYPHLLTKCYDRDAWSGYYGPMNPARSTTFAFLSKFFEEIVDAFHDDYIHLGADEVGTKCWESNPEVIKLMQRFGLDRMELVTDYFLRKLQNVITRIGLKDKTKKRGYIVWQEARDSGVLLKSGTIVQVWKGDSPLDAHTVARAGQRVLYSACWYMDRVEYGSQWMKYYQCDPGPESVSEGHEPWHDNLLGGEACMWTEYQTDDTILQRIWPLASATAERLWSPAGVNSIEKAGPRLEEHWCRLNMRGIPASAPSGPGTCAYHNVTPAGSPLKFRARNIRNHVNDPPPLRSSFDLLTSGYEHYKFSTLLLLLLIFLFGGVGAVLALRKSRANVLPGSAPPAPLLLVVVRYMTMRRILTCLGAFLLFYVLVWILPMLLFPTQRHSPAAVLS